MIIKLLKWRLGSDAAWYRFAQPLLAVMALLIAVAGSLCLAKLELTLPQTLLGLGVTFSLAIQFCIFYQLVELKRKAA
jgi:hypothetical protein